MLEKAELVIKIKNKRIIVLEKCILDLGAKLPAHDAHPESEVLRSRKQPSPAKEQRKESIVEEIKNQFDDEDKEIYFNPDAQNEEESSDDDDIKQILDIDQEINDVSLPNEQPSFVQDFSPIIEELKEELQQVKEQSKQKMIEMESHILQLKEDNDAFKVRDLDLNDQIGQLEQRNDMLSEMLTEQTQKYQESEEQCSEKSQQIQLLRKDVEMLEEMNKSLRKENEQLYAQQTNVLLKFGDKAEEAIQKELMILNQELKSKDELIAQISNFEGIGDQVKKLVDLKVSEISQIKAQREEEIKDTLSNEIKQSILNGKPTDKIRELKCPVVFSQQELYQLQRLSQDILSNQSQLQKDLDLKTQFLKQMQEANNELLEKKDFDFQKHIKIQIEDAKKQQKFEDDRIIEKLMNDLRNRVEKVLQLEMDLDFAQDEYAKLQSEYLQSDRPIKEENAQLRRELTRLNNEYHKQVSEKHRFKTQVDQKEMQMERLKLQIQNQDKSIQDQKEKLQKYKVLMEQVQKQVSKMNQQKSAQKSGSQYGNVVAPIRG